MGVAVYFLAVRLTRGCGFIGSHFIAQTLAKNSQDRVTNLDALTYAAHPDTAVYLQSLVPERYQFISANIASPALGEMLSAWRFDVIMNFAAETHVDRSIIGADAFVRTNVLGVQNLLGIARAGGCPHGARLN